MPTQRLLPEEAMTPETDAALETEVARHYTTGRLLDRIGQALEASGVDPAAPCAADLKPVDEFHIGGVKATQALLEPLGPRADMRVLDLGSGLGGTPRFIAQTWGCHVTGIDLTPEFVETATALSALVGLQDRTAFTCGSATDLPFPADSFDLVTMIHVGMNIPDKAALMAEAFRVLEPGGSFAVYDVMRVGEGGLAFPLPWATGPDSSFVATPGAYRTAAREAGFAIVSTEDRRDVAIAFFADQKARLQRSGAPALGVHLVMGPTAAEKMDRMVGLITNAVIAPVEMICRKPRPAKPRPTAP